eukprot:CAMPEP_0185773120 /NCGR_PEP_ID=MMETSP1174-20130828/72301_1 /TAXON_ID=35687 /ORGANISM="Dictyocha speculum, Strain CCMP1381" /LENGTH=67 /DNA_ID=CAMNT_0028459673 /DNA_START=821 /DNA_END=1024 /DNA_ORIENTATION=-
MTLNTTLAFASFTAWFFDAITLSAPSRARINASAYDFDPIMPLTALSRPEISPNKESSAICLIAYSE